MSHSTRTTRTTRATRLQREHDRYMSLSVIGREHGREAHEYAMRALQPSQANRDAVTEANKEETRAHMKADIEAQAIRAGLVTSADRLAVWLNS